MWINSERRRRLRAVLGFAAVQALALVSTVVLTLMIEGQWDPGALAHPSAAATSAPATARPAPTLPPSQLDELRSDASIGNLDAGIVLVSQLLDRYDRIGDTDDLYEAMQWMEREWEAGLYQRSGLATRVFERYCGNRVLRWHWVCDAGE